MYQTAHHNDGFNALRLCCRKFNPACLSYDSKPAAKLHKAGRSGRFNFSTNFLFLFIASLRYFQEQSSTVTFILKLFPHRLINLLNIFTEL